MTPEQCLAQLNLVLPPVPTPIAAYVPFRISGSLLFLSGQIPRNPDGTLRAGRVGDEVTVAQAYQDARSVGLQLLAVAKHALSDLSRVTAVVKLLGMVYAIPEFTDHPKVINGCSDLFVEVFGPVGTHARSAIGVGSLPGRAPLEIEAILEFR